MGDSTLVGFETTSDVFKLKQNILNNPQNCEFFWVKI
jgi:hypothetical protein